MTDNLITKRGGRSSEINKNGYNTLRNEDAEEKDEEVDAATLKVRAQNMRIMVSIIGFAMMSFSLYNGAYNQWIYVRFEEEALGANFSKLNKSAAEDPCFRDNSTSGDSPFSKELQEAQADAARFGVLVMLCNLVPSFFTNMILGGYSDRLGRRFIFIVALAGSLIRTAVVCAVANWGLNVNIILLASLVNGISGDLPALFTAVFIYTADNSTGQGRALAMVIAQTIIVFCTNLGTLALGYFIKALGYVWPMFTGLCMSFAAFLICIFFLRETLDKSRANPDLSLWQGIKNVFSFYREKPENPRYKRHDFFVLGFVFLLLGGSISMGVMTLFLMNEPLCWSSTKQGYALSISGLAAGLLSAVALGLLKKCLSDEIACVICLASSAAKNYLLSFSSYDWQVYVALAAGLMESPAQPLVRAVMSKMVRLEKRGSLFASIAVIEVATVAVANSGLNELYAETVGSWRGLTFFVIGCFLAVAGLTMIFYKVMLNQRRGGDMTFFVDTPTPSSSGVNINGSMRQDEDD